MIEIGKIAYVRVIVKVREVIEGILDRGVMRGEYAVREDLIEIGKVAYVRSTARVREIIEGKVDRCCV